MVGVLLRYSHYDVSVAYNKNYPDGFWFPIGKSSGRRQATMRTGGFIMEPMKAGDGIATIMKHL